MHNDILKSLDIINTIIDGTNMIPEHVQQFFMFGAIQFSVDSDREHMVRVKELIPEMRRYRFPLYLWCALLLLFGGIPPTLRTS